MVSHLLHEREADIDIAAPTAARRAGVAALLVLGLLSAGAAVSLAVYIGLSSSSA